MQIFEDFLRCQCGGAEFEEKSVLIFHKSVRTRDDMSQDQPLPHMTRVIKYFCLQCGTVLDK